MSVSHPTKQARDMVQKHLAMSLPLPLPINPLQVHNIHSAPPSKPPVTKQGSVSKFARSLSRMFASASNTNANGTAGGGTLSAAESGRVVNASRMAQPLPLISNEYTEQQLNEFAQVFQMFDTDKSGSIARDELAEVMKQLGITFSETELNRLIDDVDQDGNGEIDFHEFCDVMQRLESKSMTWNDVIDQCFKVFDRTESQRVLLSDFRYVLEHIGGIYDENLIEDLFGEYDVDKNGHISHSEFGQFVKDYMTDEDLN